MAPSAQQGVAPGAAQGKPQGNTAQSGKATQPIILPLPSAPSTTEQTEIGANLQKAFPLATTSASDSIQTPSTNLNATSVQPNATLQADADTTIAELNTTDASELPCAPCKSGGNSVITAQSKTAQSKTHTGKTTAEETQQTSASTSCTAPATQLWNAVVIPTISSAPVVTSADSEDRATSSASPSTMLPAANNSTATQSSGSETAVTHSAAAPTAAPPQDAVGNISAASTEVSATKTYSANIATTAVPIHTEYAATVNAHAELRNPESVDAHGDAATVADLTLPSPDVAAVQGVSAAVASAQLATTAQAAGDNSATQPVRGHRAVSAHATHSQASDAVSSSLATDDDMQTTTTQSKTVYAAKVQAHGSNAISAPHASPTVTNVQDHGLATAASSTATSSATTNGINPGSLAVHSLANAGSANSATTTGSTTQLQSSSIPDPPRMVDSGELRTEAGRSELKVSVQTSELGKVEVRAVTTHDGTTAHLTAYRADAALTLSEGRSTLEQSLRSRDVLLGSLDSQAHQQGQNPQQSSQQNPQPNSQTQVSGSTLAAVAEATVSSAESAVTGILPDHASISLRA